jgi:hypothetical protein
MRNLDIKHWSDVTNLQGLLFFSQLIDEMLFDYTLDTYKPLALNSRLLCIECFETIDEVKNGYIPQKSLQSVVEELKWSLTKDIAAAEIFGIKYNYYIDRLKPSELKLNELENVVGFLYHSFKSRKYLSKIIEILTNLIIEGKEKEKIKYLTNSFITELVNYGYNPNHIYYQNSNFFYNPSKRSKIDNTSLIKDFFEIFDFEKKEFTVVFIGGKIFLNFKDTLNAFNIVVTKNYNCFSTIPDDKRFKNSLKDNQSFIICSKIEALDHHSAQEKAESLIGQISGIFNFYHHKIKPEILEKTVVSRLSDNYVVIIDKPTRSILKAKYDESPSEAAKSVATTLRYFKLKEESTYRFARSIDLHGAALTANTLENQLLDLWAALETLLPKSLESNKDRIVQICDSLIPFLQLNYIQKQLNELLKDLLFWNAEKTNDVLSRVPNSEYYSEVEKVGALVSLDTTLELRKEIYILLLDFPLLKNRIYTLHELFKSPESIEKVLKKHEVKINWHLRRIYRTRGQIIHSGKYPSYTAILIENLHTYLDLFLKKIIELSIEKKIETIEQGILEIQVALQFQIELLKKHKKEKLTCDNFQEALLGEKRSLNKLGIKQNNLINIPVLSE